MLTQVKERIDRAWEEVNSAFDELEAILRTTDYPAEVEEEVKEEQEQTDTELFAGQKRLGVTVNKSHVVITNAAIRAAESSAAAALALYNVE